MKCLILLIDMLINKYNRMNLVNVILFKNKFDLLVRQIIKIQILMKMLKEIDKVFQDYK